MIDKKVVSLTKRIEINPETFIFESIYGCSVSCCDADAKYVVIEETVGLGFTIRPFVFLCEKHYSEARYNGFDVDNVDSVEVIT